MGYVSSPHFHGTYLPINQSTFYRPAPEPPSKKKTGRIRIRLEKNGVFKVPGSGYFMLYTARKCFKNRPGNFPLNPGGLRSRDPGKTSGIRTSSPHDLDRIPSFLPFVCKICWAKNHREKTPIKKGRCFFYISGRCRYTQKRSGRTSSPI